VSTHAKGREGARELDKVLSRYGYIRLAREMVAGTRRFFWRESVFPIKTEDSHVGGFDRLYASLSDAWPEWGTALMLVEVKMNEDDIGHAKRSVEEWRKAAPFGMRLLMEMEYPILALYVAIWRGGRAVSETRLASDGRLKPRAVWQLWRLQTDGTWEEEAYL